MIIQRGNSDAASFNDDSSPDTRLTSGQKLSVNAQVAREGSLDWYFLISQSYATMTGELKSAQVWSRFQPLPSEARARIWASLSKVRIHIVDPRPYSDSLSEFLRKILQSDDPMKSLSEQVALKQPNAMALSRRLRIWIAEMILSDSAGARVYSLSRFLNEERVFSTPGGSSMPEEVLALDEFGPDVKPIVRKVSTWAAKSAATFHEALDCFSEFEEELRFFPSELIRRNMQARVLKTHTFDKGDQRQMALLESARGNILENLRGPYQTEAVRGRKPYSQLDSKDSYLLQAADIAAGIASKILEAQNLVAVVSSFEYVTYNGRRISVGDAEEELRRMRWQNPRIDLR